MLVCEQCSSSLRCVPYANKGPDDPTQELAELDESIAKVEAFLAQLVLRRPPIKTRINRRASPMLRALPPEVLSRIFAFYIPAFSEPAGKGIRPSSNPLTLGAICRLWRNVAWSTPELWSCLSLYLCFARVALLTDLVREWLGRSGSLPLSIRLYCGAGEDRRASDTQVFAMLKAISAYSSRWNRLELRIPTTFFSGFIEPTSEPGTTPLLEALHLDPPDGQADRTEQFVFGRTPFLTKLHISSIYLKAITIQWDSITHVFASAFYYDEALEIMRRCPQLVRCEFSSIINGDDGYPVPEDIIHLPSLRYLRLYNDGPMISTSLFARICAPELEELVFNAGGRTTNAEDLLGFFTRSSCSLKVLSLSRTNTVTPEDLIKLLERTPKLQKLSITTGEVATLNLTDELIQRLNAGCLVRKDTAHKTLLPYLETFEYSGNQSFTWKPLMEMVCNYPPRMEEGAGIAALMSTPPMDLDEEASALVEAEGADTFTQGLLESSSLASDVNAAEEITGQLAGLGLHPHTLTNLSLTFTVQDGEPALLEKEQIARLMKAMDAGEVVAKIMYGSADLLEKSITANSPDDVERYKVLRTRVLKS